MTTKSIAAHEKEQIQEVPTNSTVPIVLRKKGHTEKKTPPHMYVCGRYKFKEAPLCNGFRFTEIQRLLVKT
ncbi:hypothetical protein AYI69_g8755 [Smittium culicis]|uniref:Uncharacterized protein n=1 Tax=Smittium culicis TaxID=133412 RepID=A0A1R1XHF1_9FUNG|nr:hypothetical protein AYI69_g8755 [Smittium culicis]